VPVIYNKKAQRYFSADEKEGEKMNVGELQERISAIHTAYVIIIHDFPKYFNLAECDDVDISDDLWKIFNPFKDIHDKVNPLLRDWMTLMDNYSESIKSYNFTKDFYNFLKNFDALKTVEAVHQQVAEAIKNTDIELLTRSTLANWSPYDTSNLIKFISEEVTNRTFDSFGFVDELSVRAEYFNPYDTYLSDFEKEEITNKFLRSYTTFPAMVQAIIDKHNLGIEPKVRQIPRTISYKPEEGIFNNRKVYSIIMDISVIIAADMVLLYCIKRAYAYYSTIYKEWNSNVPSLSNDPLL